MANRHKTFRKGGRVVYAGKGSNVEKEAEEKKAGGAVVGKVVGKMRGGATKMRLDKRARGGGIGADKSPFSTAAHGMSGHGAHHGALKRG